MSLAMLLRGAHDAAVDADRAVAVAEEEPSGDELETLRDVRLFHARVIEAVDEAIEALLNDIAAEILARELLLAPADINKIVDRALERFTAEEPLRVRVHPDEAVRLTCALPVIGDDRLRTGDAILELRSGHIDATLGVRAESVLRALAPQ